MWLGYEELNWMERERKTNGVALGGGKDGEYSTQGKATWEVEY